MYFCGSRLALVEAVREKLQNFTDKYLLCGVLGKKVNVSLVTIFQIQRKDRVA